MTDAPAPAADQYFSGAAAASRATGAAGKTAAKSPDEVKAYDPSENQEQVRSNIAYWLIAALLFVVASICCTGFLAVGSCRSGQSCKEAADTLALAREFFGTALTSITGLVGAVTGFYFGAQTARRGG